VPPGFAAALGNSVTLLKSGVYRKIPLLEA
jgi:hypothetical protein